MKTGKYIAALAMAGLWLTIGPADAQTRAPLLAWAPQPVKPAPFTGPNGITNWELSSERANAARAVLAADRYGVHA